jgi:hypothetical protein
MFTLCGGGKVVPLHVHTAGGGKEYTLYVHMAGDGKGSEVGIDH